MHFKPSDFVEGGIRLIQADKGVTRGSLICWFTRDAFDLYRLYIEFPPAGRPLP